MPMLFLEVVHNTVDIRSRWVDPLPVCCNLFFLPSIFLKTFFYKKNCVQFGPRQPKPPLNMESELIATDQERNPRILMNSSMKILTLHAAAVKTTSKKEMKSCLKSLGKKFKIEHLV